MSKFLVLKDVLDPATCARIVSELRLNSGKPAPVYGTQTGAVVDVRIRTATRVEISPEIYEVVRGRLNDQQAKIEDHFEVTLSHCEDLQVLSYRTGDFFVAHQDGNTPLIFDDTRFRKISFVIFLNSQSEQPTPGAYGSGALVLHANPSNRLDVTGAPGALVAFPSETTHEVMPVTHGERYTIVSWYR
jgi:SM-20-related protein